MKAINRPVTILGLLLLFGIIALVIFLDTSVILALLEPASPTPIMIASTTPTKKAAFQTASPIPATPQPGWQVCTGVADGHLHVRASAGHQATILGILPEASIITPTGQRDGDWFAISAPLAGWVHSKFLCGGSP
jgi:hypothetical protein